MAQNKRKPDKPAAAKSTPKPRTKPKQAAKAAPPSSTQNPIELPDGMWERIAKKAHEIWERRGYREGHDLEDWLEAEVMVMEEIHEARE